MSYDPNQPHYAQQPPPATPGAPTQPYGTPPAQGFYPPPPAPKKRKWPWIVGGIVAVMILGCVGAFALLGAGADEVAKGLNEADENQQGKNAVAGKMNAPVVDGKFEFTVTGMDCGVKSVGGEFGQKAQGEFCLIGVNIKNVGQTAELFNDASQQATDAKGAVYSVDSGAAVYANEDSSTFLEQINPGNTVKGKLVFDVPEGTKLTSVVLHESMFTKGVRIPLS
jgi:hypothetical protein